jgi:uncharacterized protein (DUF1330 family)
MSTEAALETQTEAQETNAQAAPRAYLLFAVWFHKNHGREKYAEYLLQASPIAEKYGARRIESFITVECLHGHFEPDYVFITEWPSIEQYHAFIKDPHYRAVAPILSESTEKTVVLHLRGHR